MFTDSSNNNNEDNNNNRNNNGNAAASNQYYNHCAAGATARIGNRQSHDKFNMLDLLSSDVTCRQCIQHGLMAARMSDGLKRLCCMIKFASGH